MADSATSAPMSRSERPAPHARTGGRNVDQEEAVVAVTGIGGAIERQLLGADKDEGSPFETRCARGEVNLFKMGHGSATLDDAGHQIDFAGEASDIGVSRCGYL
ncbi:MAG: hypothetical protein ACYCSF_12435 [Acidimicrobiales bacterium]